MDIGQLEEKFGIPGHLSFDSHDRLTRVQVHTAAADATIYLHGAHVTHWQPAGQEPVIFLSEKSEFAEVKAIRGGVPICFPWFGPRSDGQAGPPHGYARIQEWELVFAALVPGPDGDQIYLTFALYPNDASRSLGFDNVRLAYEVIVGRTLTMRLTSVNAGAESVVVEEALHAYFAVGDVRNAMLTGLESAVYRDKTDGMKVKSTPAGPLRLTAATDSVFPGNRAPIEIHDIGNGRVISVDKTNSATTVVWNPWSGLSDLPEDSWPGFVCVETANTATDDITLEPGKSHQMSCVIAVTAV